MTSLFDPSSRPRPDEGGHNVVSHDPADDDPADEVAFRRVLGHFASGITVITGIVDGGHAGFTCQAFTSVSVAPPLVALFAQRDSMSWAAIRDSGRFCASILASHQSALARTFGTPGVDKFIDVTLQESPAGLPIIEGAIAWLDCEVTEVFAAGDHEGALARVVSFSHLTNRPPLVYFRGGYGEFTS